jgi:hypothetical protein
MEKAKTICPVPGRYPWQILTGTGVKIAGIILMTMDHVRQMFIARGAPDWLGWFGRPVAAMFLFLCAESFFYTRSRKRYMFRFLGSFLFMSAMNRFLSVAMPMEHIVLVNNIFGALFLAVYYMWMFDCIRGGFKERHSLKIISAIGGIVFPIVISLALLLALKYENRTAALILLFVPNPLSVEGGFVLVFMGMLFYVLRKYRLAQAALVLIISVFTWYFALGDFQWLMAFAVIPILLYNGKRGKGEKYFFYVFYPAHIYLMYCAAWFLRSR